MENQEHFIVDTPNYYASSLDDGLVRLGLKGSFSFTLKPNHPCFNNVQSCQDAKDAEELFDIVFETQRDFSGSLTVNRSDQIRSAA